MQPTVAGTLRVPSALATAHGVCLLLFQPTSNSNLDGPLASLSRSHPIHPDRSPTVNLPLSQLRLASIPSSTRLVSTPLAGAASLVMMLLIASQQAVTADDVAADEKPATDIRWTTQQLDATFFAEGATAGDIDGDGHVDVVSGPYWYAGPDFEQRYPIYPAKPFDPHGYSDNFFAYVDDLNGNGRSDVLVIGFPGAAAHWYENPGAEQARGEDARWKKHLVLDVVDNESPTYTDLTGDGKHEIVCSRGGFFGYAKPIAGEPTQPWQFVPISDQTAGGRFTHGLGVGDVNGDGKLDLLEKSGWWEQPASLEGDPIWKKHPVEFSQRGGAQMFVTDVDGDGLPDVITSLEAHGYGVAWFRQVRSGQRTEFQRHMIVGSQPEESPFGLVFSQPHALALADIDGDGLPDLVAGKRWWAHGPKGDAEPNAPAVVYWFQLQRRPDADQGPPAVFVPRLIHDDSGVGTDVQAHDLTGDGRLDIVVGNKRGTFVHRQQTAEISAAQAKRSTPVAAWDAAERGPIAKADGLSPEQARAAMTVPPGFEVDLIAAEPRIHQPVAFTLDERGRIWVAEAHTYPIRAAEGGGQDRIVILEDTNGDGEFDHRKVFIEGLNLVSGLEVGFGGVWVGAAPYLLFIPDRDGDDTPDGPPVTLLDGWGYQDTHETLNAFNWGPDGWLYGCQGVFTHSRIGPPGTPDERRTAFNAGVWRYHPTRHQFEVFAHGTSNPWGIDFDDSGQAFITACVIAHAFHVVQGGRYQRQAGRHFDPYTFDDLKTIADHNHYAGNIRDHAWWGRNEAVDDDATSQAGGGHAHCGAMVYLGDNWPKSYRNTLMMANIHGNRINLDHLRRDGSGFIAGHGRDVIFANDPWFRGINLRYGPDGAVYLIDWYDPNACHRASPEIWDRSNGRLYRVRYGDLTPRPVDLSAAGDPDLFLLHEHENDWFVRTARRVLQSRYADTDAAADASTAKAKADLRAACWDRVIDRSLPADRRLRYLWTFHALQSLNDSEVLTLLQDPSENLRAWSMQLLTDRPETSTGSGSDVAGDVSGDQLLRLSTELLARLRDLSVHESSSRVRLYLASLLQRVSLDDRWQLASGLVGHADSTGDKNVPLMIWYGISPLVQQDPERAMELANQTRIPLLRQFIFRRAAMDPKLLDPLVARLADGADAAMAKEIMAELRFGAQQWGRIQPPARWSEVVSRLAADKDPGIRESLRFLSISFGDESIFPVLRATANDPKQPLQARREALSALAQGRDTELLPLALGLLADDAVRSEAIPLLARFDSDAVADSLLRAYPGWSAEEQRPAIDVLVTRAQHAHRLLDAIAEGQIPNSHLTAVHVSRIAQLGDETLVERLGELWGAVRPSSAEIRGQIEQLAGQLTPAVLQQGDRSEGRALYAKACGQCHLLFGEGGKLGPDLTGADRGNVRYWLENILDPNAVVGKDYQTLTALTEDGRVITGLLREETDVAIVLEDAEKRIILPRSEIQSLAPTSKSLMPEGLLQPLTADQIASLMAYLQSPAQVPLPGQLPPIDPRSGKVPGAIEGEAMETLEITGGRVRTQPMGNFKADSWSGGSQLWWSDGKPGDSLTLGLPCKQGGRFEVMAVMTKAVDYGVLTASINGSEPTLPIDLFNKPEVITTGPISLGSHELEAGTHALQLTLGEPNPNALPRNMVGLDYVFLVPVEE